MNYIRGNLLKRTPGKTSIITLPEGFFSKLPVMRKLISCLILIGFCMLSNQSFTQISAGIKGGVSIPNLTTQSSDPLNTGYKSSLGPDAAIFGEYSISSLFSVEVDLEYSFQGGKKEGQQALPVTPDIAALFAPNPAPKYLWAEFNAEAKLSYLMVPVLGKFGFDLGNKGAFRVYVDAGPFAAFLLSAKTITNGASNVYADQAETMPLLLGAVSWDSVENIKSDLHSFNWGIAGNIGLMYRFGPHSIFVEGGGNYGFINIQKDPANGQNHTGAVVARIGYAYTFGGNGSSVSAAEKKLKSPKVF